ncbi:hypothetical protein FRUB_02130 [Fimbriiglobus ruber]|uniref:Uncharacterized protein n=1 Tax=Fimbriiglobus ruber TaxID=1908690 RepID=A0A225E8H8_9BACT|nr:hypothetical protein FRUB_02130 [Fimbriiglobus ruber]
MFPGPNAKNPGISQHQRDFTPLNVYEADMKILQNMHALVNR